MSKPQIRDFLAAVKDPVLEWYEAAGLPTQTSDFETFAQALERNPYDLGASVLLLVNMTGALTSTSSMAQRQSAPEELKADVRALQDLFERFRKHVFLLSQEYERIAVEQLKRRKAEEALQAAPAAPEGTPETSLPPQTPAGPSVP